MNDEQRFERTARTWLEDGPTRAPDQAVEAALNLITTTPQERDLPVPWRFPHMTTFAKLAVAAVLLIAVGTVGIIALRPGSVPSVGSPPSAAPSEAPDPSPSPSPSRSPSASEAPSTPPPLSETFTSSLHGISIAYPAGWTTQAATEPWTGRWPLFGEPTGDFMYDPLLTDNLFIGLASRPLAGTNGDQWAADTLAEDGCEPSTPVTIDGASGLVGVECNAAAVTLDGRGYLMALYTSDDEAWLDEVYDRAWFEQLLTTIDLQPADAEGASPSP